MSGKETTDAERALFGRPRCIWRPETDCLRECEYGLRGPCVRQAKAANATAELAEVETRLADQLAKCVDEIRKPPTEIQMDVIRATTAALHEWAALAEKSRQPRRKRPLAPGVVKREGARV